MSNAGEVHRPPARIDTLLVPVGVLRQTIIGLSLGGPREMLAYWAGVPVQLQTGTSAAVVTTVAFPKTVSDYDHFELIDGQTGMLMDWCARTNTWVLAQVHSHPTDEPHSPADEKWPASHRPGFLSVVFPFFAQHSSVRDPHWRIYEHEGDGRWVQVDPQRRIVTLPEVWLPER